MGYLISEQSQSGASLSAVAGDALAAARTATIRCDRFKRVAGVFTILIDSGTKTATITAVGRIKGGGVQGTLQAVEFASGVGTLSDLSYSKSCTGTVKFPVSFDVENHYDIAITVAIGSGVTADKISAEFTGVSEV